MTGTAVFQELIDGLNARDLERAVSCYSDNVHYEEPGLGWDLNGRDEVRAMYGPWFVNAELAATLDNAFATGDRGAFQFTMSGTILKELPGLWPATAVGRVFSVRVAGVARLNADGLMTELVLYWDLGTLLSHIGAPSR